VTNTYRLRISSTADVWMGVLYQTDRRAVEFADTNVRGLLKQIALAVVDIEEHPPERRRNRRREPAIVLHAIPGGETCSR